MKADSTDEGGGKKSKWKAKVINPPFAEVLDLRGQKLTYSESPKRGGVRVIYFHLTDEEIVLLVMVYAKAVRANVKPKDIKRG
jgi:hypothetical protein